MKRTLKTTSSLVLDLFFENLDVASVLDEVMSKCVVRLRRARKCLSRFNCDVSEVAHITEAICGYMVKRISAHGGCLGGQRR